MPNFLVENNVYQGTATPDTPIISEPIYEVCGGFSLDAANMLHGTFWVTKNGVDLEFDLGTASFTIYDKFGVSVGITESGIVANANADFIITPVSGSALQDLAHYTARITISADSANRKGKLFITYGE